MADCLSQLVVKSSEGKYLLVETTSKKLHIASCRLREGEDFQSAALRCMNDELCINGVIHGVVRVQHQSGTTQKLTITYQAEERPGRPNLGTPNFVVKWFTMDELASLSSYVLGAQILTLLQSIDSGKISLSPSSLVECVDSSGKKRVVEKRRESELMERSELQGESLEGQMMEQAGYGQHEREQIVEEFQQRCGSKSAKMDKETFTALMTQLGYPAQHCEQCFRALCTMHSSKASSSSKELGPGLSLQQLQVGMCALDPTTPHGGLSAQFRCHFIFHFYNKSGSGSLAFPEFKEMVRDICILKKTEKDIEKDARDNWKLFNVSKKEGIELTNFLSVVGLLKFRGTSVLFRLPRSPVTKLKGDKPAAGSPNLPTSKTPVAGNKRARMNTLESITDEEEAMDTSTNKTSLPIVTIENEPVNLSSSELNEAAAEDYAIATHFVKVRRSGTLADVTTLWDLVGTEAMSGSLDSILEHKPGFDRLPSINAFDKQSKSNEMLSGLRYFEHALKDNGRGQPKSSFSWGAVDMGSVARCFLQLCAKAVDVFTSEPRLLEINSPSYVLGDLHGNFKDLVCFEKVLWRMGPVLTPASFLFLGDYVDRGEHGFEVVAYLFAQKLLMPSKFLLIRGNHEIRAVQETFSFKSECLSKFGDSLGMEVWEATNKAFDTMPIAVIIDKKVFCVHGGIPPPTLGDDLISAINDIPSNLPDPIQQSSLAWDIMWNDPIRNDEIDSVIEQRLKDNLGFIDNFARGTAYMFSSDALERFLRKNKLSHVIRAHECKAAGFQLQQHGRLLTVFSSSHYCGATNEAACVLVDSKKIRTIRLDTT